jgi:Na+(H+)/acetate symporter ActP
MSLADHISRNEKQLDAKRVVTILWLGGFAFVLAYFSMVLLSRLGLPIQMAMAIIGIFMIVAALACGWLGRTMTSRIFFFTNRSIGVAPSGLSGCTDWLSGAFLGLLLMAGTTERLILAPSAMIGMLICTILFATAFQRSNVSTLPGFLIMRYGKRRVGLISLIFVALVLSLLLIVETRLASQLIATMMDLTQLQALVLVVVLIALPTLIGGWLALVIINAILVVWILICLLLPATLSGFFSSYLLNAISYQEALNPLSSLQLASFFGVEQSGLQLNGILDTALAVLVLSCGFACLPHALSRLTLSFHHVVVLESLGWSALSGFLILSAFPLSIGLLAVGANASELSIALSKQPILQMLPALALLLAAMNAAAVTVFALSSSIIRLLRRTRNLDPGERTMFGTRALCVLLCIGLIFFLQDYSPAIGPLFVSAICISAGALFAPLTVAVWASRLSSWAVASAIFFGGSVTTFLIAADYFSRVSSETGAMLSAYAGFPTIYAAGIGMLISVIILGFGRIAAVITKTSNDDTLDDLRLLSKEA